MQDEDGNKIPVTDITVLQEKTEQVLADTLRCMGQGGFRPTHTDKCDAYCPAAKICRYRILQPDPGGEERHE